jgi:hypothetical protein
MAQQYLTSLADRLYGFRVPCLLCLICFSANVRLAVDFSSISAEFESGCALDKSELGEQTRLWDAIEFARGKLEEGRLNGRCEKATHYRILVI